MPTQTPPKKKSPAIGSKVCNKCGHEKRVGDFHKDKSKSDGRRSTCIECVKQYDKHYRIANKEKRQKQTSEWCDRNRERRMEISRNSYRRNSTKHKASVTAYRSSQRKKAIAHSKVAYALRKGILVPMRCEVCGSANSEAHHDDYDKPLSVRWFCRKHHKAHHAKHN